MDPPSTLAKDKQQPNKRSRRQNRSKVNSNKISSICLICQSSFLCSRKYKGQKFACWDCRMSSAALELGFTCPITNTIMFSPTTASDGQCYERHAIQVWIATAVDNEKQPLSPVTGHPLPNLVLRADNERLKKIEEFVVKNKLQSHPDRIKPPTSKEVQQRQTDISSQAATWLTEATPGKGGSGDDTNLEDMAQYATLSAKRRKEEIAAGADIVLVIRSTRDLRSLLRRLDCVDKKDTLSEAIGNAVDYLSSQTINECFYICKERNRIVHDASAGDELHNVQRFRAAVRRVTQDIQSQLDVQDVYKTAQYNHGVDLFYKGEYPQAIKTLMSFVSDVDSEFDNEIVKKAKEFILKSKQRRDDRLKADRIYKRLDVTDDDLDGDQKDIDLAYELYEKLSNDVDVKEDCYCLVMKRLGRLLTDEDSIEWFTKALDKYPNYVPALTHRARVFKRLEDYEKAAIDFEHIVSIFTEKNLAVPKDVRKDLNTCKKQTDPLHKTGHLKENEIDALLTQFGLN